MRIAVLLVGLLLLLAAVRMVQPAPPAPAPAQGLAQRLDGKSCAGSFTAGTREEPSEGALRLRFAIAGDRPTAQFSWLVGRDAYDRVAFALTRRDMPVDVSGFEALGAVRDLTLDGDRVGFVSPVGARAELTWRDGELSGLSDPRGGSDPRMTRRAYVRLRCR